METQNCKKQTNKFLKFTTTFTILYSSLLFSSIAGATGAAPAAAPSCQSVLLKSKPKIEHIVLQQAISEHVSGHTFSSTHTARAIKSFVEFLDPSGILFLESEYQEMTHLTPEQLNYVHSEVLSSNNRAFFAGLAKLCMERFDKLITELGTSQKMRNEVLNYQVKSVAPESKTQHTIPHEKTLEAAREKFISSLAEQLQDLISSSPKNQGYLISKNEALALLLRNLRIHSVDQISNYSPGNLPLVISKSYIKSLDAHSDLLLPVEMQYYTQAMSSHTTGLGVLITQDIKGYKINEVFKGSTAESAGLLPGDIITHISSQGMIFPFGSASENAKWILTRNLPGRLLSIFTLGEPGTEVSIKINRQGKIFDRTMTRLSLSAGAQKISTEVVKTMQGNVLHLKFGQFYSESAQQLAEAIQEVTAKEKISGIILDLRNNGGGSVDELQQILGLFVKSGPAMLTAAANQAPITRPIVQSRENNFWNGPLVVMTNSYSASASEALSGALQDYGRAIIVGEAQTFGKGSMQTFHNIGPISMKITKALFFTPAGRSPQLDGIKSDLIIAQSPADGRYYERDMEYALPTEKIQSALPRKYPMMPNRDRLVQELNLRMNQRHAAAATGTITSNVGTNSLHDIPADEAYKIITDLISLSPQYQLLGTGLK